MSARPLPRRAALERLSAGSLLALGLWPGALRAAQDRPDGSFRFLVLNDTHYISEDCGRWLERVMRQMRSHDGVEFCLMAGDLVEHGTTPQLAGARDVFKTLGLTVYPVIGNHDYLGDLAKEPPPPPAEEKLFRAPRDDRPAPKPVPPPQRGSRVTYEKLFPGRLNYWFKHRGWQFVGLDTSDGLRYEQTNIQDATLAWVDRFCGRIDKRLPTVIFTHFPLGAGVKYRPLNADALLERFREHNLQAIFSGHFHGFTERQAGGVTLTTNRCCALQRSNHDGTKEKGYFVCTAREGRIEREFVEFKAT